jgi:hypothetical protein
VVVTSRLVTVGRVDVDATAVVAALDADVSDPASPSPPHAASTMANTVARALRADGFVVASRITELSAAGNAAKAVRYY